MKLSYVLAAAIAAFSIVACEKEAAIDTPNGDEVEVQTPGLVKKTFYATVEGSEPATKALLYDTNKTKWESTDAISVFVDDNTTNYEMTASAEGASTGFTGTIADGSNYIAVYPYSSSIVFTPANAKPVEYSIPSVQEATLDSFDPKAAVFIADTDDKSDNLTFKAAFALLKVSVDKDNVLAVYVENATLPMSGSIAINTSAEVEDGSRDKFTWVSLKKSDGTALVQGDYYIVVRYLDAAPYETFKLTYIQDDATSNTRSAASLPAASLGRNDILRLGSLTSIDAKYTPAVSWFNYYQACLNLTIGSKTINRTIDGDATLWTANNDAVEMQKTPIQAGGAFFLKAIGTGTFSNSYNPSIIAPTYFISDGDAKVQINMTQVMNLAEGALYLKGLSLGISGKSAFFTVNKNESSSMTEFIVDDCYVNQNVASFVSTNSSYPTYGVEHVEIVNSAFAIGTNANIVNVSSSYAGATVYKEFIFNNNYVYGTGGSNSTTSVFSYTGTDAGAEMNTIAINNNLFYNAANSGIMKFNKSVNVEAKNNLIWVTDGTFWKNDKGEYTNGKLFGLKSAPTGTVSVSDNAVYGTLEGGSWVIADSAVRPKMSAISVLETDPITSANVSTGTFTMAAGYESYGPQ